MEKMACLPNDAQLNTALNPSNKPFFFCSIHKSMMHTQWRFKMPTRTAQ